MKEIPLVTIITPCYNGEKYVNRYFESIIAQTYQNIELIFVDDGSVDGTGQIAKAFASRFLERGIKFIYVYQENGGQAKAMNAGLARMRGTYLVWPDSDDLLDSNSIENRVDFMEKNIEFDMVRSNGDYFEFESGKRLSRISNFDNRFKEDIFLDLILETTYCSCGCYMIRVSSFKRIYPNLKIYESDAGQNWQILIPMAGRYKCGYIDEDQYHIAVRTDSHSRKERTLDEQVNRYLELKKILLQGIDISRRCDQDYKTIVDDKYNRILMKCYLAAEDMKLAKIYYLKMKKGNTLKDDDKLVYFSKANYFMYTVCRLLGLEKRIVNKCKRIIKSECMVRK